MKNYIQIIHEDNDTYTIEDMRFKRSMCHGSILYKDLTKEQLEIIKKELE